MKVLTWNINGIRASNREVPLKKLLDSLEANVICLQETKVTRDQLDEATAIVDGYNAFFSFSTIKGGYSGVATFCKTEVTPTAVEEGLTGLLNNGSSSSVIGCYATSLSIPKEELASLDAEGRAILSEHEILDHKPIVIVNLYCPRADRDNEERWAFKQNFYHLVQARCEALLSSGKDVMIVGDLNVSHTKLDHCDPDADPEYFASNESRIWLSQFLLPSSSELARTENESLSTQFSSTISVKGTEAYEDFDDVEELSEDAEQEPKSNRQRRFVDVFRSFHRTREYAFTCWSTVTGARKTNYGTRIDYIIVNKEFLMKYAVSCDIRPDIHGSDHCPVVAAFSCSVKAAETLPDMCTSYMPEFRGRQKSIKAFFQTGPKQTASSEIKMRSETLACAQSVTEPRTFGNNGNNDNSKKRKAGKERSQNQAKMQKTGMKASQTETGSNRSLASYFKKSITNTQKNKKVDKKEIIDFFAEANITDSSLKEEIFRDTLGSLAETKANECKKGVIGVTEMNEMKEICNISNSGENSKKGSNQVELTSFKKQITLSDSVANINSTFSSGCATEQKNEENGKSGGKIMQWKSILKGSEPPPLCEGHKEECVLRTVKKQGPNLGRQFYCCSRPEGRTNDKEARCKTFKWRKK